MSRTWDGPWPGIATAVLVTLWTSTGAAQAYDPAEIIQCTTTELIVAMHDLYLLTRNYAPVPALIAIGLILVSQLWSRFNIKGIGSILVTIALINVAWVAVNELFDLPTQAPDACIDTSLTPTFETYTPPTSPLPPPATPPPGQPDQPGTSDDEPPPENGPIEPDATPEEVRERLLTWYPNLEQDDPETLDTLVDDIVNGRKMWRQPLREDSGGHVNTAPHGEQEWVVWTCTEGKTPLAVSPSSMGEPSDGGLAGCRRRYIGGYQLHHADDLPIGAPPPVQNVRERVLDDLPDGEDWDDDDGYGATCRGLTGDGERACQAGWQQRFSLIGDAIPGHLREEVIEGLRDGDSGYKYQTTTLPDSYCEGNPAKCPGGQPPNAVVVYDCTGLWRRLRQTPCRQVTGRVPIVADGE